MWYWYTVVSCWVVGSVDGALGREGGEGEGVGEGGVCIRSAIVGACCEFGRRVWERSKRWRMYLFLWEKRFQSIP